MIPSSLLQKKGARFTRVVQKAGVFIISFCGGYHSGFNCGFNAAEAVNFATPGWLNFFPGFRTFECTEYSGGPKAIQNILQTVFDGNQNNQQRGDVEVSQIGGGTFQCDQCLKVFTMNKNLLAHKRIIHSSTVAKYQCSQCSSVTVISSPYDLKYHFRKQHRLDVTMDDMRKLRIH